MSSDGWTLLRRPYGDERETWDVLDPSGDHVAGGCHSVTAAQDVADKVRRVRTDQGPKRLMTGCLFCGVTRDDDCSDDCLLRGLSAEDAEVLAMSRENRISTLTAEAEALRWYARNLPVSVSSQT